MPDETHLVSDKLFITDNLHIKEDEEFITLLDFVHRHSITSLKFPSEVGIDEDSYTTQEEVIAVLEQYLKTSATHEELKSIWLLKRKDGKETTDDTRDEFYFNEATDHLERIGTTKIDFSDITDDVTFKAAVTFQTPDGKDVAFVKSPKVNNNRVLDVGDIQQSIWGSPLPPSSSAVQTYVDTNKLKFVQENVAASEVYVGPHSNLTVGPNASTFKTPINLNSTGAAQSPAGTLSNDDGVLKWNGEEVGGTLTVTDNNPGGQSYEKTKEMGFQGNYVAIIKDSSGAVQLYIRENTDNPALSENIPSHDSLQTGYIYKDSITNGYQLPKGISTNESYGKCFPYNANSYLSFQFKNVKGGDDLKIDTIQSGEPLNTPITIIVYSGSTPINTISKKLSDVNGGESTSMRLHTDGTPILKVWNGQPNYKENVEGGKTPYTFQVEKLFIELKQSHIVREGGSFRIEVTIGGKTYISDDVFLYKNDVAETITGQSASVTGPTKYVSGYSYFTNGSTVSLGGQGNNLCYYYSTQNIKVSVMSNVINTKGYEAPSNADKNTIININGTTSVASNAYGDNPTISFNAFRRNGQGAVAASFIINKSFWCKTSSSTGLSEDFWGERDTTSTSYHRKTAEDGQWDSSTSIDLIQGNEYGLQVKYGHLLYPTTQLYPTEGRTYYRWFKGSGDATLNQFNITVKGLPQNHFNDSKTTISIKYGDTFYRLNQLQADGGLALSTPTNNKWKCGYLPSMTQHPSVGEGFFLMIKSTDTSLNIEGPITIEMNPA